MPTERKVRGYGWVPELPGLRAQVGRARKRRNGIDLELRPLASDFRVVRQTNARANGA